MCREASQTEMVTNLPDGQMGTSPGRCGQRKACEVLALKGAICISSPIYTAWHAACYFLGAPQNFVCAGADRSPTQDHKGYSNETFSALQIYDTQRAFPPIRSGCGRGHRHDLPARLDRSPDRQCRGLDRWFGRKRWGDRQRRCW